MSLSTNNSTLNGYPVTICEANGTKYYLHKGPVTLKTGERKEIYVFFEANKVMKDFQPTTVPDNREVFLNQYGTPLIRW
jgi:hypothetical protein